MLSVLDELEEIAPVCAARGNGDIWLPQDPRLKKTWVIEVEGWRIGLSHGLGLPEEPPWRTLEKIMSRGFGGPVDIIIFGGSHVETIGDFKGVSLVNPGSPTLPHNLLPRPGVVALLDVADEVTVRFISLGFPLTPRLQEVYNFSQLHRNWQ